ncbi:MAG: hypothetical protein LBC70_07770 [Chitinispirillales bacterium]|jgi:uncharacterized protein (TIGR02145 family)|nr:hypothetical protein [Chitinispirillales bacterium]
MKRQYKQNSVTFKVILLLCLSSILLGDTPQRQTPPGKWIDCSIADDVTLTTMTVFMGGKESFCIDTIVIKDINLRVKRSDCEELMGGCMCYPQLRPGRSMLNDTDTLVYFGDGRAFLWVRENRATYVAIIDSVSLRKLREILISFEMSSASCMWECRPDYLRLTPEIVMASEMISDCVWKCRPDRLRLMPETVMTSEIDTNATVAADINIPTGTAATVMTNVGPLETVTIGGKTWLKKNLNIVTDGSWCYHKKPDMCARYGRLYNWDAAVKACNALGDEWRLPDTADWNALIETVGSREIASTKLKSKTDWILDSRGNTPVGTDTFGFSALPGGCRAQLRDNKFDVVEGTEFGYIGEYGYWWSATERFEFSETAYFQIMGFYGEHVGLSRFHKGLGFSVRCMRD